MKKPFVNWEEIEMLVRPPMPQDRPASEKMPGRGLEGWNNQAPGYNKIAELEKEFTLNQLDCLDITSDDTVLDVCCGPGRISVPAAKRAKQVTSLDASSKMLEFCMAYAQREGVENITPVHADWEDEAAIAKVPKHDIVIASRNLAMFDTDRLSALANRCVAIVIWSFGCPSVPAVTYQLFKNTRADGQAGPGPLPGPGKDRRLGNNLVYNKIYDKGYNPNLRIVDDGFMKTYGSYEEAYDDLRVLGPEIDKDRENIYRENVNRFITENEDGTVTFLAKTGSIVLWWKPEKEEI